MGAPAQTVSYAQPTTTYAAPAQTYAAPVTQASYTPSYAPQTSFAPQVSYAPQAASYAPQVSYGGAPQVSYGGAVSGIGGFSQGVRYLCKRIDCVSRFLRDL